MRAILVISKREYLSYVATIGFWLSLLAVPISITIGATIPALIESSKPTRYFTVIDQTGQGLDRVIQQRMAVQRRENMRDALEFMVRAVGDEAMVERALALFDEDPEGLSGLQAAAEEFGITALGDILSAGQTGMVQVEAPGASIDELRPYMTGDQTVETRDGPKSLFAVLVLRHHDTSPVEAVYYSTSINDTEVRDRVLSALRAHLREQAYIARGLSLGDVREIGDLRPNVLTIDARPGAQGETEVTVADRAPFIGAMVFAFILWISVFSVANMLLSSMVEEKGGKIIELLLSTARLHEILIGKLFGVAGVSLTLFAIWGLMGFSLSIYGGSVLPIHDPDVLELIANLFDPGLIAIAFLFFVVGYLMYGSIFLAMGSLCETLQDAQTLMGPVIWMLLLPMMFIAFSIQSTDSAFIQYASWVPLWTPFIMLVRLPNDVPTLEIVLACAAMIVTMFFVLWAASAIFRQGALGMADAETVRRFFRLKGRKKSQA